MIKDTFTKQDMSWKKLIVFSVATAVVTAVLKLLPFLDDTSLQDIAINPECWILFAVFIIVNCNSVKEACAKTFVFFIISQPLIYLIQVPFSSQGFGLFSYYRYWFIITLLTIPGAAIAYQVKKKNWLSAAVLAVAVAFLGYMAAEYFWNMMAAFPRHLLSFLFCMLLAVFLTLVLLDKKAQRAALIVLLCLVFAAVLYIRKPIRTKEFALGEGSWTFTGSDPAVAAVEIDENNNAIIKALKEGYSDLVFRNADGEIVECNVTVKNGSVTVSFY